jgi:hypothetical protein
LQNKGTHLILVSTHELEVAMLTETDHPAYAEPTQAQRALDALVPDPAGKRPMCSEEAFVEVIQGWVADAAPRLFAVVQEYGDRVDARIAGWGIAFEDRADILGVDGAIHKGLRRAEDVLQLFHFGTHITSRLVWFNPDAVTPTDNEAT